MPLSAVAISVQTAFFDGKTRVGKGRIARTALFSLAPLHSNSNGAKEKREGSKASKRRGGGAKRRGKQKRIRQRKAAGEREEGSGRERAVIADERLQEILEPHFKKLNFQKYDEKG